MDDGRPALELSEDNPWPGLAAYDEASQRFFHGREPDSAELLRLIRLSAFVALYGKSGLGKSSMLQAGLFPRLRGERFLPVYLRLDYTEKAAQPLLTQAAVRLGQEIRAAHADAPPPDQGESLWAYLQRREWPIWDAKNYRLTPVLVFDQFEEVFSRGGSPGHVKKVLDSMADLVGDRLPADLAEDRDAARRLNLQLQQYRVVLSFRSDFLADVESWEKQANLPRRESLHLMAMSRERAIDAVERAGAEVLEPGVATRIVDFLLHREGRATPGRAAEVEPVLLSLCCYQLNRRRMRPAKIDAALLNTVGEGILKGFYDEALRDMEPRVSVFIEENLIQGDRYRNSYALEEALKPGGLTQRELDQLRDSRLLRVDPQGDVPRIELIHDRLVSVVRDARDARLAREEQQRKREEAEEQARAERERERLVQTESERARVARWRNWLAVTVMLLLVAIGGLVWLWLDANTATALAKTESDRANDEAALAKAESDRANVAADRAAVAAANASNERSRAEQLLQQAEDELRRVKTELQAAQARGKRDEPAKRPAGEKPAAAPIPSEQSSEARPEAVVALTEAVIPAARSTVKTPLILNGWRLSSGGCRGGEVSVTGTVTIRIKPAADRKGVVVVEEKFETPRDADFKVKVTGSGHFDKNSYYDIDTRGDWKGPNGREFTTEGLDRVFVDNNGAPARVSLIKLKTQCPG